MLTSKTGNWAPGVRAWVSLAGYGQPIEVLVVRKTRAEDQLTGCVATAFVEEGLPIVVTPSSGSESTCKGLWIKAESLRSIQTLPGNANKLPANLELSDFGASLLSCFDDEERYESPSESPEQRVDLTHRLATVEKSGVELKKQVASQSEILARSEKKLSKKVQLGGRRVHAIGELRQFTLWSALYDCGREQTDIVEGDVAHAGLAGKPGHFRRARRAGPRGCRGRGLSGGLQRERRFGGGLQGSHGSVRGRRCQEQMK